MERAEDPQRPPVTLFNIYLYIYIIYICVYTFFFANIIAVDAIKLAVLGLNG